MGAGDKFQAVDVAKIVGDFGSEDPSGSAGVDGPIFDIFWVGPHEIAEGSLMWNFYFAVDGSDLIDGFDFRAESSVNAEDLS